ncbi:hypothetical protein Pla110_05030 [Polystyrenella longa]|uniref:Uncharacterized protein n=1 Tax=Polystyrenella longa TaxID=2528007 RepID=A0A518CHU4_9PLAN|nr:DUF1499 domain-containing protein [Polystyrenella longa]QDU78799.1 hypothetical protein Pla110_05030 [Polystyrenella longa]
MVPWTQAKNERQNLFICFDVRRVASLIIPTTIDPQRFTRFIEARVDDNSGQERMKMIWWILWLILVLVLLLFALGLYSWWPPRSGLVDGKLRDCPASPNCVSSQAPPGESHYVSPLAYRDGTHEENRARLKRVLK